MYICGCNSMWTYTILSEGIGNFSTFTLSIAGLILIISFVQKVFFLYYNSLNQPYIVFTVWFIYRKYITEVTPNASMNKYFMWMKCWSLWLGPVPQETTSGPAVRSSIQKSVFTELFVIMWKPKINQSN